MTIYNELPTAFPWYDKREKQQRFREHAKQFCDYRLISPTKGLLPFQIYLGEDKQQPIRWEIFNICDTLLFDISSNIDFIEAVKTEEGLYCFYRGQELAGSPFPENCRYYSVLTFPDNSQYFSEVFTAFSDLSPFIKIEYSNSGDISPLLYKASNWKQVMYLDTFIHVMEPEIEEDGERDGADMIIPTFQRMTVKYRFTVMVPDFFKVALTSLQMHDDVFLTTENEVRSGKIERLTTTATMETTGAYSTVDVLLEQLILLKHSCADEMAVLDPAPWRNVFLRYTVNIPGTITGDKDHAGSPFKIGTELIIEGNPFEIGAEKDFIGWNTQKDGSGTAYHPGDPFKITEDTILYLMWKIHFNQIPAEISYLVFEGNCPDFQQSFIYSINRVTLDQIQIGDIIYRNNGSSIVPAGGYTVLLEMLDDQGSGKRYRRIFADLGSGVVTEIGETTCGNYDPNTYNQIPALIGDVFSGFDCPDFQQSFIYSKNRTAINQIQVGDMLYSRNDEGVHEPASPFKLILKNMIDDQGNGKRFEAIRVGVDPFGQVTAIEEKTCGNYTPPGSGVYARLRQTLPIVTTEPSIPCPGDPQLARNEIQLSDFYVDFFSNENATIPLNVTGLNLVIYYEESVISLDGTEVNPNNQVGANGTSWLLLDNHKVYEVNFDCGNDGRQTERVIELMPGAGYTVI